MKIYTYLYRFCITFWKYILILSDSASRFENIYLFGEILHQILKIHTYLKKFCIKCWKYILIWRDSVSNFEITYLFEEILYQILKIHTYLKKYPGGGEIFRTRPDLSWDTPSFLYNGYRVFPWCKATWTWRWPHTLI